MVITGSTPRKRPVVIVDYDPQWPVLFAELRAVLWAALGDVALAIEHVGSTSVPGLAAKPIIDLDVVIEFTARLPDAIRCLAGLGYSHEGDKGIPGREAFARAGPDVPRNGTGRTWPHQHLYACAQDSTELARQLAFRDYLRAHPDAALAYERLKRQLAEKFRDDRDAYCDGKSTFVEEVLRRARE